MKKIISILVLLFCFSFVLTGCVENPLTFKEKQFLKDNKKEAIVYYEEKYGETPEILRSYYDQFQVGGAPVAHYNKGIIYHTISEDGEKRIQYIVGTGEFADNVQIETINSTLLPILENKVLNVAKESGYDTKIIYSSQDNLLADYYAVKYFDIEKATSSDKEEQDAFLKDFLSTSYLPYSIIIESTADVEEDEKILKETLNDLYQSYGYPNLSIQTRTGQGIENLGYPLVDIFYADGEFKIDIDEDTLDELNKIK